jgi:hypothetical protein
MPPLSQEGQYSVSVLRKRSAGLPPLGATAVIPQPRVLPSPGSEAARRVERAQAPQAI